jgi:hypothetical protein
MKRQATRQSHVALAGILAVLACLCLVHHRQNPGEEPRRLYTFKGYSSIYAWSGRSVDVYCIPRDYEGVKEPAWTQLVLRKLQVVESDTARHHEWTVCTFKLTMREAAEMARAERRGKLTFFLAPQAQAIRLQDAGSLDRPIVAD